MAVAVGVSDRWQVKPAMWYVKHDRWHLTPDILHLITDTWHLWICLHFLYWCYYPTGQRIQRLQFAGCSIPSFIMTLTFSLCCCCLHFKPYNIIDIKGTPPQNIFILKSGNIGHINSLSIGGLNKFFKKFGRSCNLSCCLVPETISSLYVRSKVCMAPFHLPSKVCIVPIHVQSKVCKLSPHMDGSNADFAPHMKGSHEREPKKKWRLCSAPGVET